MSNFTAFRFTDNDFHTPLQEAIRYVVKNKTEDLTLENFRVYVLRGLSAFDSLRRIDNNLGLASVDYSSYFDSALKVFEVNSLTELESGFDGYVFDHNLLSVYYVGY